MGITIFKTFIWGGISSDIHSEITFSISDRISDYIPPQMKILNTVNPLIVVQWTKRKSYCRGRKLTLNAPNATKVVCYSRLLKCSRSLYGKQCRPRSDCSCSRSMLFASILNSSVMLGNYLQQTTFSDAFFSWCFKG